MRYADRNLAAKTKPSQPHTGLTITRPVATLDSHICATPRPTNAGHTFMDPTTNQHTPGAGYRGWLATLQAEKSKIKGAAMIIVGHSERRADHAETDATVRAKAEAAWRAGLIAIVCVGETQAQRDAGKTIDIVGGQLAGSLPDGATPANLVVAYEPVWAIGTGLTPTSKDVENVHEFIRKSLIHRFKKEGDAVRILYGGSVKPSNAAELMAIANVDGALVGGASFKAADFLAIAAACP